MTPNDAFICDFLGALRISGKGTWRTENSISLAEITFDEILGLTLQNVRDSEIIRLFLCDSYNTYSQVCSVRLNDGSVKDYLVLDQHMDALNRIFNAIFLSENDSGHDVWKLAYELFMEERMVSRDNLLSAYFGMNKLALGDYDCQKELFSKENNFLVYVQMAYIIGHEIGHWIQAVADTDKGAERLNLKDNVFYTRENILAILQDIYAAYEKQFQDKDYHKLIMEQKELLKGSIVEECTADAIALAAVFALIDRMTDAELESLGFDDEDSQLVALRAILIVMLNIQILAMARMTMSLDSYENEVSIRISFLRNYVYQYFEDIPDELNRELETVIQRYEHRITNVLLEAFSELEERMDELHERIDAGAVRVKLDELMEL